ncbi:OPT oligopeptide transporter protein domain-containing protein [Trichoderma breve]|uniref:OPT oligopeptide transporter protein domain-containing protein n=1 Tax=Trichoderma breve TaxID=2034170 RepID=A0A9W9E818_9HYPO|nr:OPT oligopeptide transporter protein domain-containing protein [Trichoderma breve]KAJ4858021.1 OPT oligopeptide transporter protein domain-containing protein [Trichoderma breve]
MAPSARQITPIDGAMISDVPRINEIESKADLEEELHDTVVNLGKNVGDHYIRKAKVEEIERSNGEPGNDVPLSEKIGVDASPFPEVQAAVRNYDEEMPANTIRAWAIGLFLVTICGGMNMLFHLRSPAISISTIVAQFLAYPIGRLWSLTMPQRIFMTFGVRWSLNPGPFNVKEHVVVTVMSFGWGFQLLLTWTSTMIGYGIAGISRRFLVWPAAMIWPSNLVSTSLMYTLHDHAPEDTSQSDEWSVGRYRYFIYVAVGSFVWYWVPGFLFEGLSVFAGISLIPLTLDWTVVSAYVLSPLIPPWYAIANTLVGVVVFFWITAIAVHFSGVSYAKYIPMGTSSVYDNTGKVYNVSRVLNPDITLNIDAYKAYSPLFLPTT